jgi:hypothetical protein
MELVFGLTKIEFGEVAGDGGMGTSLTQYADTEKDTVKLTSTDPETKEFLVNEKVDPIKIITTKDSVKTIELGMYDMSGSVLAAFMGGTATAYAAGPPVVHATYTPPSTTQDIERSIRLTTDTGHIFEVVRGKLSSNFDWAFTRSDLGRLKVKITILAPTKANTDAFKIIYPDPA